MKLIRDKQKHPEWDLFQEFFNKVLIDGTNTCFERDVLRAEKDSLWLRWVYLSAKGEQS